MLMLLLHCPIYLCFQGFGRSPKAQERVRSIKIHRPALQAPEAHLQRRLLQEDQEKQEALVAQRPPLLQVPQVVPSRRRRHGRSPPPHWLDFLPALHHREQERFFHSLQDHQQQAGLRPAHEG